jgi:hypothetical protein
MYAMIRRYSVADEDVPELMHRCDVEFADQLGGQPGFMDYQLFAGGDGTATSITIFETEDQARASTELASRWVSSSLSDLRIDRLEVFGGEVEVSRAADSVLEPAHA